MDQFSLTNIIKEPTYSSKHGQSLIDVALTNAWRHFQGHKVIDTGCSDGHSMITVATKMHIPKPKPRTITYRSFKTFIQEDYKREVSYIPFSVAEVFDDVNDIQWAQELLLLEVLNEHAPQKVVRSDEPPYMNNALKKAIMCKTKLHRIFKKSKTTKNWEAYRIQRNLTTNLRRNSIKTYFKERCEGGPKNKNFWITIKPFISSKSKSGTYLTIRENDSLVTEPEKVADTLNNYYVNTLGQIHLSL